MYIRQSKWCITGSIFIHIQVVHQAIQVGLHQPKKDLARLLLCPSAGLLIVSCEDSEEDAPLRVIDNARVAPEFSLGRGTCL